MYLYGALHLDIKTSASKLENLALRQRRNNENDSNLFGEFFATHCFNNNLI